MKELLIDAKVDNLNKVLSFVDQELEELGCSFKSQMQLDVAVEEIFVNIASYSYQPGTGSARICLDVEHSPLTIVVRFIDSGIPYDPLKRKDPNVTLGAADRAIGGLGIYMAKKSVDEMLYEYREGKNILTLRKKL